MAVTVNTGKAPRRARVSPITFNTEMVPPAGGPEQTIQRPGARFEIELEYPPLRGADALALQARLLAAKMDEAIVEVPQPAKPPTIAGTPRVNGSGFVGKSIMADGFAAGDAVVIGQYFSILTAGRYYLHMITTAKTAVSGAMQLDFEPMLRHVPSDNDLLIFNTPYLQGRIVDEGLGFEMDVAALYGFSFTVREKR